MADPRYGSLPFAEAIAYLRDKVDIPSVRWDDLEGQAHDRYFMVAGAAKADLLADLHAAVLKAIEQGTSIGAFREDFARIVAAHGWHGWTGEGTAAGEAWRTRVIYSTNLRTSYAAGRYSQMKALADRRPYWRYKHNDTVMRPRPHHKAWDGTVLRHDDPWWDTHYTPNGWGCRCYVETLAPRDLAREGITPGPAPDDGTYTVERHGVTHTLPTGVDYGWDHAPGRLRDLRAELAGKAGRLPEPIATALLSGLEDGRKAAPAQRLRARVREMLADGQPDGPGRAEAMVEQHIAQRETRHAKPVIAHGMSSEESHVEVAWDGLTFSYRADADRARVARAIVDLARASLPRRLMKHQPRIVFSGQRNKDDAYWAAEYGVTDVRTPATGGDGVMVVYDVDITARLVSHEAGHALAWGKYGSIVPPLGSDFRHAIRSAELPPTEYADKSYAEDFAESVAEYWFNRQDLRRRAPRRYKVIHRLMSEDDYGG